MKTSKEEIAKIVEPNLISIASLLVKKDRKNTQSIDNIQLHKWSFFMCGDVSVLFCFVWRLYGKKIRAAVQL